MDFQCEGSMSVVQLWKMSLLAKVEGGVDMSDAEPWSSQKHHVPQDQEFTSFIHMFIPNA